MNNSVGTEGDFQCRHVYMQAFLSPTLPPDAVAYGDALGERGLVARGIYVATHRTSCHRVFCMMPRSMAAVLKLTMYASPRRRRNRIAASVSCCGRARGCRRPASTLRTQLRHLRRRRAGVRSLGRSGALVRHEHYILRQFQKQHTDRPGPGVQACQPHSSPKDRSTARGRHTDRSAGGAQLGLPTDCQHYRSDFTAHEFIGIINVGVDVLGAPPGLRCLRGGRSRHDAYGRRVVDRTAGAAHCPFVTLSVTEEVA